MHFGAHLPLIDFDNTGWAPGRLRTFAEAARDLGFDSISSNDHLVFQKPWLDGITALASVIDHSGDMKLCTTIAVPAIRHPNVLAKHAAAIDLLSGGRLILGVGPGSSARDYALVGRDFEQRWKLIDSAVKVLRSQLKQGAPAYESDIFTTGEVMAPAPAHDIPIWIGSWGSGAGLRRVARLGDGWLASAYNTTAEKLTQDHRILDTVLTTQGKDAASFPTSLATMWAYVTDDKAERDEKLAMIATMLNRPPEVLAPQILVGPAEECAAKLRAYATAGVSEVFLWPLANELEQLERFATTVTPLVPT